MPTETFRATLGRIAGAGATDGQLLTRFVADRDGDAFAVLVRRHGPMVFGVCQRMLGDHHDAEDAVQAVFLVLARRAQAVSPPDAVGNFLYGVAHRTALEARAVLRRRSSRERTVAEMPEPIASDPEFTADLRAVLDAELARLPGKYRALLVACDLEGRPRREVAASFGLPDGTLCSRLSAARTMLGERLRKRGLALTALAALAAAREASAVVPHWVLDSAARIGRDGAGAVPGPVAALASRVVRTMTPTKVFVPAVLIAAMAAGLWVAAPAAEDPKKTPEPARAKSAPEPKPRESRESRVLVWRNGFPALYTPDGKLLSELPNEAFANKRGGCVLSPDGKRMAYSVPFEVVDGLYRQKIAIRGLDENGQGEDIEVEGMAAGWSRDGKRLYGSAIDFETTRKIKRGLHFTNWVYDLAAKTRTVIDVPSTFALVDETDGGKRLLFDEVDGTGEGPARIKTWITAADGSERKEIKRNGLPYRGMLFSPDGTKVLMACHEMKNSVTATEDPLAIYDVKTEKITILKMTGLPKFHWIMPASYQWSPDGKRILFGWQELHDPATLPKAMLPGVPLPGDKPPAGGGGAVPPPPVPGVPPAPAPVKLRFPWNLSLVDVDGKNMKVILTDDKHPLDRFDWK